MSTYRKPYDDAIAQLTQAGSPFEVARQVFDGVEYLSFCNAPTTVHELLAPAREHGAAEFIVYGEERWSFDDFFTQVDTLAARLQQKFQVQTGVPVAIAMRNYPEWLVAYTAIIYAGGVAVPLNAWSQGRELQQGLDDAGVELIFSDLQRAELLAAEQNTRPTIVVRAETGSLPAACQPYAALLEGGPATPSPVAAEPEQAVMIMFTSGTTGRAKGAVFSHRNLCQAIINFEACGAAFYFANADTFNAHMEKGFAARSLLAFPLFHVSGLCSQFYLNLRGGRSLVFMYKWRPEDAIKLIAEEQITVFAGTPSMLLDLMNHPDFAELDTSSLISLSAGGQAQPRALLPMIRERTDTALPGIGWGMTESTATGASVTGHFMDAKPGASGFLSPIVELKFCDDKGAEVEPGTPGEIWLKSPTTVRGYCNAPDANEAAFQNGWYRTGDIGYLDEDQSLYICDRVKDMVIRGGENIYPVEVEHCLRSHEQIESAVAFGIASERFGEELVAVVRMYGTQPLSAADIQAHCAENLAAFKVPSQIKFSDEPWPQNASGKIIKHAVKAAFFAD